MVDRSYNSNRDILESLSESAAEHIREGALDLQNEMARLWVAAYLWSAARPAAVAATFGGAFYESPMVVGVGAVVTFLSRYPEKNLRQSLYRHDGLVDELANEEFELRGARLDELLKQ